MARPRNTTITSAHVASARQHCENCADRFKDLTFLVDTDRLPRETCGIKVATVDAAEKERFNREERENRSNETGQGQFKARPPELFPQDKLLAGIIPGIFRRLFITGAGGTGKTEYARLIALRIAERFLAENGSDGVLVPYHVELKVQRGNLEASWSDLLEKHLAVDDREWLVPFAYNRRVAFIFDGLDECGFDTDKFSEALARLIQKFNRCVFVLAGRPGSLPPGLPGFDEKRHTHEIQPLTDEQIHQYAVGVFGHWAQTHEIAPDAPGRFLAELRSNQRTLYPLIRVPFMLAFAAKAFRTTSAVPSNPAALVALGLTELFEVRRTKRLPLPESNDTCFDVLSTLAAFALVRPRGEFKSGPISFSITQAKEWLKLNAAHIAEMRGASRPDAVAGRLIDQLAPASGVLFRTGTDLTFSNRVLAEFLAARWIVSYGYPHWPYRDRSRHYVDPSDVPDERERQLLDFFGDFAWNNAYDPLAQAVRYQLGRDPGASATDEEKQWHSSNTDLLLRCARWFYDAAEPLDCRAESSLDARATLVSRISQFYQALPGDLSAEQEASVNSVVQAILPPATNWAGDLYWRAWIANLPAFCRRAYLKLLLRSLGAADPTLERNWVAIGDLALAIASDFSAHPSAMAQALQTLTAALAATDANLKGDWSSIRDLCRAIASGFSADPSAMEQALQALTRVLNIAVADSSASWSPIGLLASTIASDFSAHPSTTTQALRALTEALAVASASPTKNWAAIGYLARAIASGFSNHASAMEQALQALTEALAAACADPKKNTSAIGYLSDAIATCFSAHLPAMEQALQALTEALDAASDDPEVNGPAIGYLADAIATCFPAHPSAMEQALQALTEALNATDASWKGHWFVIRDLAGAITSGFSTDLAVMGHALKTLTKALDAAKDDLRGNWFEIGYLAGAIASGFSAHTTAMEQALQALIATLDAASDDPKEHEYPIGCLADRLASGFSGNLDAAVAVIRVGQASKLKSEAWSGWVTLCGPEESLLQRFAALWDCPDDSPIIKPIEDTGARTPSTLRWAVIVAPREKIRRGLPASLLKPYSNPGAQASPPIVPASLREPVSEVQSQADHSDDFTSVNWFGKHYTFTKGSQSEAVRVLWEAWEKGGHSSHILTIAQKIGTHSDRFELGKVFRKRKPTGGYQMHPAWGTMIRRAEKGCYQLVPPQEHATPNAHEESNE